MSDETKPKPAVNPPPAQPRPFEAPPLDYDKRGLDDPSRQKEERDG